MKKTLLFFDIDGTLAMNDEFNRCTVSKKNFEGLELLKNKGYFLAACTGRQAAFVRRMFPDIFSAIIANSGNCIFLGDRIIFRNVIAADQLERYADIFRQNRITSAAVGISDIYVICHERKDIKRIISNYDPGSMIHYDEDVTDKEVMIFDLFFHDEEEYLRIKDHFTNDMTVNVHDDITLPVDVSFSSDKAKAAKNLLEYLNDEYVTYGFGDGCNDVSLIRLCDKGIAMSNGVQQIKQVADYVSDNDDNEGVYKALKYYGLI